MADDQDPATREPATAATLTVEELLVALGREVVRIRKSVGWIAFLLFLNAVVLALTVSGVVVIEFRPVGG